MTDAKRTIQSQQLQHHQQQQQQEQLSVITTVTTQFVVVKPVKLSNKILLFRGFEQLVKKVSK